MGRIINLLNDLTNCFDVINDQTFLFISDSDLYPYTLSTDAYSLSITNDDSIDLVFTITYSDGSGTPSGVVPGYKTYTGKFKVFNIINVVGSTDFNIEFMR
jgi:hypothetical protein